MVCFNSGVSRFDLVRFQVIAVTRDELRVSRHGIAKTKGGRIVSCESFEFPDTPYYLAFEMVRDEHPECEISIIVL